VVYQLVFAVVLTAVTMFTLRYLHSETSHGSSRVEGADEEEAKAFAQQTDELALSMPPPLSPPQSTVLPFTPVTLAFKGLSFSVGAADGGEEKHLLRNINGFVAPGTLTALMGASGAGKTTLMDVLAGRKTQGRIRGEILINGYPKQPETFSRIAGGWLDSFVSPFAHVLEPCPYLCSLYRLCRTNGLAPSLQHGL